MALESEHVIEALPGYDIGDELGRGAWGVVLAGRHRQLSRKVAIKQLPRAFGADQLVRARFTEEGRLLASLDHPHIIPIYDFVEHRDLCLLVMERLTGGTVAQRFSSHGFRPPAACAIVLATCAALEHAHEHGILHRDVKPENLMFSEDDVLKVTDFGLAKVLGGSRTMATTAGEVLGTPAYMAPEQAQGAELGPATDVYAAGVILYEFLSGQLPFPEDSDPVTCLYRHVHEPPRALRRAAPGLPPRLTDATMRALQTEPADRYESAEAFGVAIAEAARHEWGPGWLADAGVMVLASGAILAGAIDDRSSRSAQTLVEPAVRPAVREHPKPPPEPRPGNMVPVDELRPEPQEAHVGLDGGDVPAPPIPRSPPPPSTRGRRPRRTTIAVVLGLLFAAAAGALLFLLLPSSGHKSPRTTTTLGAALRGVEAASAWRPVRDAPVARQQVGATEAEGTIWVFGGLVGSDATDRVEGYDPAIDTWKAGPRLPLTLHHEMAVTYNGELVVIGGWVPEGPSLTAVTSDRVFALRQGRWAELPRLTHPRAAGAAAVVGNRIVVVGGQAGGELVPSTEVFDGTAWHDAAAIPTPRDHLAAVSDGHFLYAVGGRALSADKNFAVLERYDPANDQWQKLPDMPTPRGGLGAALVGSRLVAVGGENPTGVYNTVEAYDLTAQSWSALPNLRAARHGMAVVAVGNSIYAIGGGLAPTHAASSATAEVLRVP